MQWSEAVNESSYKLHAEEETKKANDFVFATPLMEYRTRK